uniref:Ubiquitin domain-containing protein UBFD1 n=1 Tax=Cacopsylla melanoneura TaxID=428564 RepID=A0A8D8RU30_9HEMI
MDAASSDKTESTNAKDAENSPPKIAAEITPAPTTEPTPVESKASENKASIEKSSAEHVEKKEEASSDDKIISFTVIYSKQKCDVKISENSTVLQLKTHLEPIIGVPQGLQKIMFKGLAKNGQTLKSLGITNNTKVMVVGSKLNDVLNLATVPSAEEQQALQEVKVNKEPWCRQKMHRTVLDKGLPDDVMPGILNTKEPLPPCPLSGMLNKAGGKLRITFRLELDELWLGTKERTEKIRMSSIKSVLSEPIEGQEQYHIMALQLGTTEASRYWIYYVPAQYVDSIKHIILDS